MRRALSRVLTMAVGAASLSLPATAAYAIDPPTVRVTPGVSSVVVGSTRQLSAAVTNLTTTTVTWSMRRGAGSVSATGLYTPPATAPADPWAVVRATSTEDPSVYGDATVAVASGVPGGAFGPEIPIAIGGGQDADMGDIDGDGRADVVMFQNCCNNLSVGHLVTLRWNGTSAVRGGPATAVSTYQENGFTATSDHLLDIELGDLDGDGDLDVYVPFGSTQAQYWRYQVWRNDGTGTFTPDARVRTTGGARSGARARLTDFDGDGKLDAVRMEWFGGLLFEKGNGDGTFQEPVFLMSTFDAEAFDVGDLTGDGRPEIAVGMKGTSNSSTTIEVGINNGFGGIASKATYDVGMAPEPRIADTDGDGWNDVVVGVGGEHYAHFPPKLLVLANLAGGTGALNTTAAQLLPWRPRALEAVHVDGDGVLDLAGYTNRGPVLLRRTGANAYDAMHAAVAASGYIHHATFGDLTGDGRLDTFTNHDDVSQLWPGSADPTLDFSVKPTVTRLNATHTAELSAVLRNSPVEPKVTWSASRGTFSGATYTAPATAAPTGTAVTVTASLTGTASKATRTITVVNDRFQFTSLGGQNVRQVVADPAQPLHLYAATATGVYRSQNGGVSFSPLGTTGTTGTDAKQVTVTRDGGGATRVVAIFGTALYRIDVAAGDWLAAGPASPASVSAAPGTSVVWAAAGGQVHRSDDGGGSFTALGQTSVTEVDAVDANDVWLVRGAAPRVSRGTYTADASPALTTSARELPAPAAAVTALAVHPADRTLAYVATGDAANPLFRGNGGAWTAVPTPGTVDRLSVSPAGTVLAARAGTLEAYKSTDSGAAWHSVNRGFASVTVTTVAHRGDGLDLAGTSAGLYTPVETVPPAPPAVTGGPSGLTGPGGTNAFSFTFGSSVSTNLCSLDDSNWTSCTSPKTYSGPLASGEHTFAVVAYDENGNESAPATRTWTVDATPPPVPTITGGPTGLVRSTSAAFTFTLDPDAASATCALDNAAPGPCVSGVSYSSLGQGAHTFSVRAVDTAGNASAAATRSWTVDTVPPTYPHFWSAPQWVTSSTSAFFQWQSDNTATYACTLDGSPVACSPGMYSVSGLPEGAHTFGVTASDTAGNTSANAHQWTVDLTDPSPPAISVKPPASTDAATAHFEFASPSSDVSYYLCQVDDGWENYCYGSADYADLAVGGHTFFVRAIDHAGRTSTKTQYAWTIAVPAPVITAGPSGLVGSRTATFAFTTAAGTTTTCSLDGATAVPCSSGVTYDGLTDGPHTFAVTATKNGASSTAATRAWTVDATAPAAPVLTAVPPARTASPSAQFAWEHDGTLTYTCTLDAAPVQCGTGGVTLGQLGSGEHQFVLTARDAALNAATATYTWTVDRTAPVVSLSTKPPALSRWSTALFEFGSAAPDLAGFTCTVDGTAAPCTSPLNLSSLGEGEHTFAVFASDDVGNNSVPATWTWTVDTVAPTVTLTQKPPARVASATATFDWTASETGVTWTCTLAGSALPAEDCVPGLTELTGLNEGPQLFSVQAVDAAGNEGPLVLHEWTIDLTGPAVALHEAPPALSRFDTATFAWRTNATDLAEYRCSLDGAADVACASGLTLDGLADGPHTFAVWGVDGVGNPGPRQEHGWSVDTAAITATLTATPPLLTKARIVSFEWDTTEAPASEVCTIDDSQVPCGEPYGPLADGQHTFSYVAFDAAGNASVPAAWTWTVDGTAPVTAIATPSASLVPTHTVSWNEPVAGVTTGTVRLLLTGTATAVPATLACRTAANTAVACTAPTVRKALLVPTSPLVPGQLYTVSVGAVTDLAGNAAAAKVAHYRASTIEQETSPAARQSWRRAGWSGAQGGSYHLAYVRGATASYTFTGTSVTWYGLRGPTYGLADVYVDNVLKASRVNLYATSTGAYTRTITGLSNARHTIKIVVRGERGTSAARGTDVAVDAFKVGSALSASPPLSFTWGRFGASVASGGAYAIEGNGGATVTVTFRGRGIDWVTALGPNMGKATVVIDGVNKGTFDNYASSARWGYVRTFGGLTDRVHTMTITVLGQRRAGATGNNIVFDRLGVRP